MNYVEETAAEWAGGKVRKTNPPLIVRLLGLRRSFQEIMVLSFIAGHNHGYKDGLDQGHADAHNNLISSCPECKRPMPWLDHAPGCDHGRVG